MWDRAAQGRAGAEAGLLGLKGPGRQLLLQERGHPPGSVAVDRGTHCGPGRLLAAGPLPPPEII